MAGTVLFECRGEVPRGACRWIRTFIQVIASSPSRQYSSVQGEKSCYVVCGASTHHRWLASEPLREVANLASDMTSIL